MACFKHRYEQLLLLTIVLVYSKCDTNGTKKTDVKRHQPYLLGKPTLLVNAEQDPDYDETYYKDLGNVADLQNRTLNFTNSIRNEDDEDSHGGDYLDELGSAADYLFPNFNPDPYISMHFLPNMTTVLPTVIEQDEETSVDFEVTEPITNFMNAVPNYINDTLPKCPDGFDTYQNEGDSTICFLNKDVTVYPHSCPHPNYLESHTIPNQVIGTRAIWGKPITKMFDSFGASFVTSSWLYNSSKTSCAVYNNSKNSATPCSSSHSSICAFTYEDRRYSFDNYCRKRFNESCVAADLGSFNKCYCVVTSQATNQNRSGFCNKLAEPVQPYQNHLLLKKIEEDNICWIGFYHEVDGTCKWSSTNSPTTYTYWSFTTDFAKTNGAIGQEGWSLEKDGDLNCALCEVNATDHAPVHLSIKHNKITNKIRLTVDNAIEIFGDVYCYSYSNEYRINIANHKNHFEIDIYDVNDIPRYYWCKALQIPQLIPVYSNRILAHAGVANSGHEYAIANKREIPSSPYYMTQLIFNETDETLYHVHTAPTNYTILEEIDILAKFISAEVRSSEVCLPLTTFFHNTTLNWPQTLIGTTALPDVYCIQDNGHPVTRQCTGSFLYGASWSVVNGSCSKVVEINATLLYQNLIQTQPLMGYEQKHTLLELHHLINTLKGSTNFMAFIQGINNLMDYPTATVKTSQLLLNSTDSLLDALKIRLAEKVKDGTLPSIILTNLAIRVIQLSPSSIFGLKLNTSEIFIEHIYDENSFTSDFDMVLKMPVNEPVNCSTSKLAVTLFRNDVLFGDSRHSNLIGRNVILLLIPQTSTCNFSTAIEVFIAPNQESNTKRYLYCASWRYGQDELMQNIHGSWSTEGTALNKFDIYKMCKFEYGTYSTFLEEAENIDVTVRKTERTVLLVLGILTIAVTCLSLLGVLITLLVFKSYTNNHFAIINLSIASAAQLTSTYAVMLFEKEGTSCVILAAILHYTTLAQFLWVVIIALLQQNLYVRYKEQKEKLTLQTCFAAWGFPLLVVVLLASVSKCNYGKISYDVCYPMGNNFTYSVLLPVSILLLIALIIYGEILGSVRYSKKIKTHHLVNETSFSPLKLAVMLSLVIGITWGLGSLTAVVERKIMPYLFTMIACIQEVVIFLFFIVLNDKTRSLWVGAKNIFCMGNSKGYELTSRRKKRKIKYTTSRF